MSLHGPLYLLPQSRKLRHLRGISLRNLTFARPRGRTIDDGNIHRSSDSRDSLRLIPSIPHAHSSDDIRAERTRGRRVTLSSASANARQRILEQALEHDTADAFFSLHHHGDEEPIYVSEVEEKATNFNFRLFDLSDLDPHVSRASRLTVKVWVCRAGVWSLLIEDDADLRFLGCIGPSLQGKSRGPGVAAGPPASAGGTNLDGSTGSTTSAAMHFPPNSVVFHLVDGIYMFGLGADGNALPPPPPPPQPRKQALLLETSSYTALMRLANLENSLRDSLATRDRLAAQIDDLLAPHAGAAGVEATALPDAQARTRRVLRGAAHQRRGAQLARQKRDDIGRSLQARRAAIAAGRALQQKALEDIEHAARKLAVSHATAMSTAEEIRGQRRRVCEDLIRIFSIEPIPTVPGQLQPPPPLSFQICGMALPNTDYGPMLLSGSGSGSSSSHSSGDHGGGSGGGGAGIGMSLGTGRPSSGGNSTTTTANLVAEEVLSAALGFVAVLASALQSYLGVVLPYRITPYGSRSVIRDDISKIPDQQREFPLHMPRGGLGAQYRFDYAWFLLNKDIETLCSAQGIKVVDIRHTLPNLKYLLYVCSSGSKELPQRKRGGVRGLRTLSADQNNDDNDGRDKDKDNSNSDGNRGSPESLALAGKQLRDLNSDSGSNGKTATASPAQTAGLGLPFADGDAVLTLRTKGMRENINS